MAMLNFREILNGLRDLDLEPNRPVIAHASLSAFGDVQGGADTMLGALLAVSKMLIMPAFTYKTMIIPEIGPANNGLDYGKGQYTNQMALIFDPEMPVDRMMGQVPEALRQHPKASRSLHPILSFTGVNAVPLLNSQTYLEPLAPIGKLLDADGWVLLLGVDHTVNTSIHYGEQQAGRKQFVRWALTRYGVRECPGFPGCSEGFQQIEPWLIEITRRVQIGVTQVQAIPLTKMIPIVIHLIQSDPAALLCSRPNCPRCGSVRAGLAEKERSK